MSPFGCTWRSLLKIKRTFEGLRSRLAVIPNLHLGLCPADDQRFIEHQSGADRKLDVWPINLRLGVPTLNPKVKFLLATPPSLSWAFTVALEFYRLQAKGKKAQGSDTNLTEETVGVLENWMNFMTYGTLLKEDSERYSYINKNLVSWFSIVESRRGLDNPWVVRFSRLGHSWLAPQAAFGFDTMSFLFVLIGFVYCCCQYNPPSHCWRRNRASRRGGRCIYKLRNWGASCAHFC